MQRPKIESYHETQMKFDTIQRTVIHINYAKIRYKWLKWIDL